MPEFIFFLPYVELDFLFIVLFSLTNNLELEDGSFVDARSLLELELKLLCVELFLFARVRC